MLGITLRSVRAHWRRFLLTTSAVVIGVAFVVGSFTLSDSLGRSIDTAIAEGFGTLDLQVQPASASSGPDDVPGAGLDDALVQQVAAVAGVRAAEGSIYGVAQIVGDDGEVSATQLTILTNYAEVDELSTTTLTGGAAPRGPDEAVVDAATAERRGLAIGDTITVATSASVTDLRIVGLVEQAGSLGDLVAVPTERAQELLGRAGRLDAVLVDVEPRSSVEVVQEQISTLVGEDVQVLTSAEIQEQTSEQVSGMLSTFTNVLLGFAAVTLFVSGFLIWNTFSMVLAQRSRDLALLRAIGASERQVAGSVLGEGLVVGLVASVLGLGLGVLTGLGLQSLLSRLGGSLPSEGVVMTPRTVLVAFVVGLGVTLVSVVGPARRATRVPPVAAMTAAVAPSRSAGRAGTVLGVAMSALGLVLGGFGLFTELSTGARVGVLAAAAVLLFLGVASLARHLAAPVIGVLGALPARLRTSGDLARRNAVRNPRRTASTASALMIGLALVTTTLVVGQSVKAAIGGSLERSLSAQVVVHATDVAGFDQATVDAIAATDGVRSAVALRTLQAQVPGEEGGVAATSADTALLPDVLDVGLRDGSLPTADDGLAVSADWAEDRGLGIGDTVTLQLDGVPRELQVTGRFDQTDVTGDLLLAATAADGSAGVGSTASTVLVATDAPDEVIPSLEAVVAQVPGAEVDTTADYVDGVVGQLDTVLAAVNALLVLTLVVAGLGIANTLALSVVERTRELGLLRAVGMERRPLRSMIRTEGFLVSVFGGLLGVALGLVFGAATVVALPDDLATLSVPTTSLLVVLVGAGVIGVLASALPARRAGRLEVLDALAPA